MTVLNANEDTDDLCLDPGINSVVQHPYFSIIFLDNLILLNTFQNLFI